MLEGTLDSDPLTGIWPDEKEVMKNDIADLN